MLEDPLNRYNPSSSSAILIYWDTLLGFYILDAAIHDTRKLDPTSNLTNRHRVFKTRSKNRSRCLFVAFLEKVLNECGCAVSGGRWEGFGADHGHLLCEVGQTGLLETPRLVIEMSGGFVE